MAPNILWVVWDTARLDALEPYGAPAGTTPVVAELARRGHALPHAYATASWTLPSHASMFTGLLPRALGLGQAPEGQASFARGPLESHSDRLIPQVLRGAGYRTVSITTNLWVSRHSGFDLGFDDYHELIAGRQALLHPAGGVRSHLRWAREALRARSDDGAERAGEALRASIRDHDGRPTLWFVNLVECHSPYLPPRPWNDLGPLDRLRAARDARVYLSFPAICRACAGGLEVPPAALRLMRHLYGRAVSSMDAWLARALEALDERGALDETLVIVTSDHGENFAERDGLISHAFSLDERLIHVPFVWAGPGAVAVDAPFSLARLPAALAAAAEVQDAPYRPDELPDGVAVAQLDPLAPADHAYMREFVREHGLGERGRRMFSRHVTAVSDGRTKLTVQDGEERVHDLTADPLELRDHPPAGRGEVEGLRAALGHPAVTATPGAAAAPTPPTASAEELEQLERQMKLLGYM